MKFYKSEEYQKKCIEKFEQYQSKITKLLPHARIEHIGASSVPGAVSKGDLDIFVGVDSSGFEAAVSTLKTLGFREKQGTLRTKQLCMLESLSDDAALQIVANGSEFEFFLTFRDKLRENKELVIMYNDLKTACSGFSHNKYRQIKSAFISEVLKTTKL